MVKSCLGVGLLSAAAFMFLLTSILSIASCSLPDWIWMGRNSSDQLHEGLWSTCMASTCGANNHYSGNCLGMLNAVRAFSIMTIIFAFFTFLVVLAMLWVETPWLWILALVLAILTVCMSVIPWAVYLGFVGFFSFISSLVSFIGLDTKGCLSGYNLGAGWSLAVSALPMAVTGLTLLLVWVWVGRGSMMGGGAHHPPAPMAPRPIDQGFAPVGYPVGGTGPYGSPVGAPPAAAGGVYNPGAYGAAVYAPAGTYGGYGGYGAYGGPMVNI